MPSGLVPSSRIVTFRPVTSFPIRPLSALVPSRVVFPEEAEAPSLSAEEVAALARASGG